MILLYDLKELDPGKYWGNQAIEELAKVIYFGLYIKTLIHLNVFHSLLPGNCIIKSYLASLLKLFAFCNKTRHLFTHS